MGTHGWYVVAWLAVVPLIGGFAWKVVPQDKYGLPNPIIFPVIAFWPVAVPVVALAWLGLKIGDWWLTPRKPKQPRVYDDAA